MRTCETCIFFKQKPPLTADTPATGGWCRYNPPSVFVNYGARNEPYIDTFSPWVSINDWCGKHQSKSTIE